MLNIPEYVEKSGVRNAPIQYKWQSSAHYARDDNKLRSDIELLSIRAVLALSAAVAEWIVWRLEGMSKYPTKFAFIEAVWAAVIDPRYTIRWRAGKEPSPEGPTEIPIFVANELLSNAFKDYLVPSRSIAKQTVYLCFLAKHVVPGKSFVSWLSAVLLKLRNAHPWVASDEMGIAVSREALDPERHIAPGQERELLEGFLAGLDISHNRFLQSPEELKRLGFEGVPYRL